MNKTADLTPVKEGKQEAPTKNFEDEAGLLSTLLVLYLDPLFEKGARQTLELEDLGPTAEQDRCDRLYELFEKNWQHEIATYKKEDRSIWRPLWKTVGYSRLLISMALYAVYTGTGFGPILILNQLVQHFDGTIVLSTAVLSIFVALVFVLPVFGSIVAAQSNIVLAHVGLAFRNILINKIYRKSLNLSPAARQQSSTGQIVNMFSADTAQVQRFMFFLNNVFLAPITIGVCLWLIYRLVGPATFAGLGLIVVVTPLTGVIFEYLGTIRKKKMVESDNRVKLMNEILNGVRVIKYYAWEQFFADKIQEIRIRELMLLKKLAYITAVAFSLILMAIPIFLPVIIFYVYSQLGNNLTSATAFTTIALFNLMQFPFVFLPLGLSQYSQCIVSSKRMMDFFVVDELHDYIDRSGENTATDGSTGDIISVSMENANLCWILDKHEDSSSLAAVGKSEVATSILPHSTEAEVTYKKLADTDLEDGTVAESKDGAVPTQLSEEGGGVELVSVYVDSSIGDEEQKQAEAEQGVGREIGEIVERREMGDGGVAVSDAEPVEAEEKKDLINRSAHTLMDFNFQIKKGSLVAVVGPVGSGKSSLLNALLGEMHIQGGKVCLHGSVAYCDQRAWILNDSLKGNILFGQEMDEDKFDNVLYAAALDDDINVLPGGIQTQIGEKGINLSGGQKARVALARAMYRDAEIYLLDDPLSAVDAHVGQFLFHECIKTVLKGKTRILVTHQVHLLPYMDHIIILNEGRIAASGTYDEIIGQGVDLENLLPKKMDKTPSTPNTPAVLPVLSTMASTTTIQMKKFNFDAPATTATTPGTKGGAGTGKDATDEDWWKKSRGIYRENSLASAKLRKNDSRSSILTTVEERAEGNVPFEAYAYYIRAGGMGLALGLLVFMILAQGFQIGALFWLQYWGAISVDRNMAGNSLSTSQNIWYLQIFAALSSAGLLCYVARSLFLANHRVGTSKKLHNCLLDGTFSAPVSFFDVTPVGRILNRFSADLVVVDEELSQTISQVSNSTMSVLGALAAIAAATKGIFLIIIPPLIYIYNRIQHFFRATNTAIARLESVSRSPIYAGFSQALNGVNSIRAYGVQDEFIKNLVKQVDGNSVANMAQQLSSQWLAIRLDMIGATISFFVALVAAISSGFIPAGFLAIGLMYSLQVTVLLKFLVRMLATGEAQMNAVERLRYFETNLDKEGLEGEVAADTIPAEWPSKGVIKAQGVSMRYRTGPLVLTDVSFDVKSFDKVGIAGRTGSGKSSLVTALFRMEEIETGNFYIDGIDIATVPLSVLRSRLGIIPQEAVMFSFTVRFNLDPSEKFSDLELWQVLTSLNLKDHIMSLPGKLQEEVSEGGDNFSAGQRQLICIARAILRKPKVLVLDEATASIDNDTDSLVQQVVREQFGNCTVLTIAHRLHTIIDSDLVMTLESGVLKEFGPPQELIKIEDGLFKSLWDKHQSSHGGHDSSPLETLPEDEVVVVV